MFCSKCGNTLPDTARFCDKCGAPLERKNIEAAPTAVQTVAVPKTEANVKEKLLVAAATALVLMLVVGKMISGISHKDEKAKEAGTITQWAGYTAELEQGKRVKTATLKEVNGEDILLQFVYEITGEMTSARVGSSEEYERLSINLGELCKDRLPIDIQVLVLNESLNETACSTELPMATGLNLYSYNGDAQTVTWRVEGNSYSGEYAYDNKNRVTRKVLTSDEGATEEYQYSYDSQGRVTSVKFYGTEAFETGISYDSNGNMVSMSKYDSEGNKKFDYLQTFDAQNRITKKQFVGEASFFGYTYTAEEIYQYRYDEQGNLVKLTYNDYSEEYGYDEKGNQTEIRHYNEEGVHEYTYVKEYDTDGNVVKHQEYAIYGENPYLKEETEYQYDKNGNLIATRNSSYSYEANSDYSIVNQIEANEGEWRDVEEEELPQYEWDITYYTDEEWEQYQHDQEFTAL